MIRIVARLRRIAAGTPASSACMSTTSAVSIATSVPEPMAPRLVFQSKRNLKAVSSNAVLRHKLGVALHRNFNWRNCEKVIFTDDFVPYSFLFQSYTSRGPDLCGGLILHGQEDLKASYYGIHT